MKKEGNAPGNLFWVKMAASDKGILTGKADKETAEYVGYLARKRKKEQKYMNCGTQAEIIRKMIDDLTGEIEYVQKCMDQLQDEYTKIPDFFKIHTAMQRKRPGA